MTTRIFLPSLVSIAVVGVLSLAALGSPPAVAHGDAMPTARRPPEPPHASATVSVDDFVARVHDDGKGHKLPYRLFVPRQAQERPRTRAQVDEGKNNKQSIRRFPLVVFLHGAGGRGTDNRGQIADQDASLVFVQPENQARWPVFMVAPQCPPDQQWVDMPWGAPTGKGKQPGKATWPMVATLELVDQLQREHPEIDPRRLYVTGMSMGGFGTWDLAVRAPDRWRAAVIICGGYDELAIAPLVRVRLPIWAFHAADDLAVPVGRSREMVAALRAQGSAPRYTEYPASAHYGHFSWRPAYSDPALLPWMFGAAEGD